MLRRFDTLLHPLMDPLQRKGYGIPAEQEAGGLVHVEDRGAECACEHRRGARATASASGEVGGGEHSQAHATVPDRGTKEAGVVDVAPRETPVAATIHGQVRGETGRERE